ncbi:MAG: beta-ketoacyl-[acyl-carrier-protein] synthase family protein [Planctomycetaceae bacterium]|nr:beta-ketoacyl-[acyl-carrier-protein] synthase family protein [Planctomycetaceae bacterium]
MVAGKHQKRFVITGVGIVSPIGIGRDQFWNNLIIGASGIDRITSLPYADLPTNLAAEVKEFHPEEFIRHNKFLKTMSRDIQLGVAAASLAMKDSGLKENGIAPDRLGVVFGAGRISTSPLDLSEAAISCIDDDEFEMTRWGEDGMGKMFPLWLLKQLPNMAACHVSIEHNARGPNNTITSRESSALLALNEAIYTIQRGAADCMIVGACSSNVHPVDITKLSLFELLAKGDDDPKSACRPFDFNRTGTVVGEGSAVFIVEDYEHARKRGAEIYAEVLGVGAGCDGNEELNGGPGTGIVQAVKQSMRKANIDPREIGHINAHGKSTLQDDLVEARAYHRLFNDDTTKIPVTALKSYFGNFDAGSGAVELAGSILALHYGKVPQTLNYRHPDPGCQLNVIHDEPHKIKAPVALSVNRTQIGQSVAALLRAM